MYFQDEKIPPLVPIKIKKKVKEQNQQQENVNGDDLLQIFAKEFDRRLPQQQQVKQIKQTKPAMGQQKMEELQKKYSILLEKSGENPDQKDKSVKSMASKKEKENMKSKYMINELMKKIDAKNITEELYPITNQAILGNIRKLDVEIEQLKVEGQRKENSLVTNPNNQHLRKELANIKNSIDHCVTIKELYNEKINLRNKVSTLEKQIVNLKEENQALKTKNQRDLETIDNHMHGMPCEKERQLKDQLNKCKIQIKKVTQIKEKLENNISQIVQYFKRLYEEADIARLIVIKKLKQLQQKEKKSFSGDQASQKNENVRLNEKEVTNASQNNNNSNPTKTPKKPANVEQSSFHKTAKEPQKLNVSNVKMKAFSLEEQIKKMRNQQNIGKTQHKR